MFSRWMYFIRRLLYTIGVRPSSSSFFYSDSLVAKYKKSDYDVLFEKQRRKSLKKRAKEHRKNNWGGKF